MPRYVSVYGCGVALNTYLPIGQRAEQRIITKPTSMNRARLPQREAVRMHTPWQPILVIMTISHATAVADGNHLAPRLSETDPNHEVLLKPVWND